MEELLSVGVDIGTSTTSMVVSRLSIQNTASSFSVPHVAITDQEIVYRGEIYQTPLLDGSRIDVEGVARLLREEYRRAGVTPDMLRTGAVIITGESARKENAQAASKALSQFAGDFVIATAGPGLESILAAKGAGAQQYAKEHNCTVLNLDVGGGTSNLAAFSGGELLGKGCWDIGGRLIRVDQSGLLRYLSPRLSPVLGELGLPLSVGDRADPAVLRRVTDRMAGLLAEAAGLVPATALCQAVHTPGSSQLVWRRPPDRLSFSGGVADYVYTPPEGNWFRHGDVGPLLGRSIADHPAFPAASLIRPTETIRATVVGAGSYTTVLSGSTIYFTDLTLFPARNLPAFVPGEEAELACLAGDGGKLAEEGAWFRRESGTERIMVCLSRTGRPGYQALCRLADGLMELAGGLPAGIPLYVLVEQDFAQALGQTLRRRLGPERPLVCLDSVHAETGDYLDLGHPLMGGVAVPVVVKTLIYG